MKKSAFLLVLLAAVMLGFYQWYSTDPNIIDEDYISSEEYRKLQQNIAFERSKIADRDTVLKLVVKHMLANDTAFQQRLPYRLDSLALDRIMSNENSLSIPELRIQPSDLSNYTFYGVTILEGEDYRALLSLIELPGVFRDLEVGLTTVRDGEIIDRALIGRYEKNLSTEIHSEIFIGTDNEIQVKVEKSRFYPFEQEKRADYRYRIASDGRIVSTVL